MAFTDLSMKDSLDTSQDEAAMAGWGGFLFELGILRRYLHLYRLQKKWDAYFDTLVSYYMTLSAMMVPKKKGDDVSPMFLKHNNYYNAVHDEYKKYSSARHKKLRIIKTNFIGMAQEWELSLRQDEKILGLLMPSKDDPNFAFSKGGF